MLTQAAALVTHPSMARRCGLTPELPDEAVRIRSWFLDLTRRQVLQHDAAAQAFLPL